MPKTKKKPRRPTNGSTKRLDAPQKRADRDLVQVPCPRYRDEKTGNVISVGREQCLRITEVLRYNEDTCSRICCGSPWRRCTSCLKQGDAHHPDSVVSDPMIGLCEFHMNHGLNARRSEYPEDHEISRSPRVVQPSLVRVLPHSGGNGKPAPSPIVSRQPAVETSVFLIPRGSIRPFPEQPRTHKEEEKLQQLAESILEVGQQEPVKVRKLPEGEKFEYELIDGERRFIACGMVGIALVRAIVMEVKDKKEQFERAVISNFCREGHTELEEASAIKKLMKDGRSVKDIAKRIGKSEPWIYQRLKLLTLAPEVRKYMYPALPKKKCLTVSIALALTPYPHEYQTKWALHIVRHSLPLHRALAYMRREAESVGIDVARGNNNRRRVPSDDFVIFGGFVKRVHSQGEVYRDWDDGKFSSLFENRSNREKELRELADILSQDIEVLSKIRDRITSLTSPA